MTTQLQQCREVAAALDEEVTEWRRKDAEWHEHRSAAEKALHDMPFVMDNYRAALARAEAAEAEAARLQYDLDRQLYRADAALARVADLEAELAAQQWRPVTEDWPPYDKCVPVRMRNGAIRWGFRRGDFWHLTVGIYGREGVTHAYVLPPAPQETE